MNKYHVEIVPNWEVSNSKQQYYFDMNVNRNRTVEHNATVNSDELEQMLKLMHRVVTTGEGTVCVYAYYHGNTNLIDFYSRLIETYDCEGLHMEYEWGWDKPNL